MTKADDGLQGSPVGDVREQPEFAGALDRGRELGLVAPACAGHARRADLALVAYRAPQRGDVPVIDRVDLVPAERTRLAPGAAERALAAATPAVAGRTSTALLRHCLLLRLSLRRGQNGMS